MSLKPQPISAIPEETVHVAHAIYPKGNIYMRMRAELGTFFSDEDFVDLFPYQGQPALAPWQLALVTVMQFVENCRIVRRLRRCGIGFHGNMRWG